MRAPYCYIVSYETVTVPTVPTAQKEHSISRKLPEAVSGVTYGHWGIDECPAPLQQPPGQP